MRLVVGPWLVALFQCCSVAAALAEDQITLLGSNDLAPKSWLDDGVPRGYAVDTAAEVLRRCGYQVSVKLEPWPRAVEDADRGVGVITHFSKTPDREAKFDFSEPLVYDRIVAVVRRGREFPFHTLEDLAGKRVGVLRSVRYGGDWQEVSKHLNIEEDTDAAARIGKLLRGHLDAAIISSGVVGLRIAVTKAGLDMSEFSVLPQPIMEDPNYLAIVKGPGSSEKIARINVAIRSIWQDGTVKRVMVKYGDQAS